MRIALALLTLCLMASLVYNYVLYNDYRNKHGDYMQSSIELMEVTDYADALYWQMESQEFLSAIQNKEVSSIKFIGRVTDSIQYDIIQVMATKVTYSTGDVGLVYSIMNDEKNVDYALIPQDELKRKDED